MLRSLFPKAHPEFLSLPLLGPITDGFDDWLAASGFTPWLAQVFDPHAAARGCRPASPTASRRSRS